MSAAKATLARADGAQNAKAAGAVTMGPGVLASATKGTRSSGAASSPSVFRQPGRAPSPATPATALSPLENAELATSGRPLGAGVRARFEPQFGSDLSQVRIYTGAEASRSAAQAGALAYTLGSHIVFAGGRYDPESRAGQRLLTHELAHVVQQGRVSAGQLMGAGQGLRSSTAAEEREAEHASHRVLAGQSAGLRPGSEPALARADKEHSDDDLGEVIAKFRKKNDHLTSDQLDKIRSAVINVAFKSNTFEVAYSFFDYYSGFFGQKILLMSDEEAKAAAAQDRVAETQPGGNTKLRKDTLSFSDQALGALLLHELSHTGQSPNMAGFGDYQEGHSYGIEYFYAEQSGDKDRMNKILGVMSAGSVTIAPLRDALRKLFKESYAIMTVLRKLSITGAVPGLKVEGLTQEDGQILLAQYVTKFSDPSEKLKKVIDYVSGHLEKFKTPPL